jgi:type II secretory pathway component PulC
MTLTRKTVEQGLLALNALFAATLLYFVLAPLPTFEPPQVRLADRPRHATTQAFAANDPPAVVDEIGERPMFLPSRKPIASPMAAAAQTTPPDVALVGIILDGQDKLAMLRTPSAPFASSYRLGASVQGWQVTEITSGTVVLTNGGTRDEIRLQDNRAASKPPAVGAPPAGPQPSVQPASQ